MGAVREPEGSALQTARHSSTGKPMHGGRGAEALFRCQATAICWNGRYGEDGTCQNGFLRLKRSLSSLTESSIDPCKPHMICFDHILERTRSLSMIYLTLFFVPFSPIALISVALAFALERLTGSIARSKSQLHPLCQLQVHYLAQPKTNAGRTATRIQDYQTECMSNCYILP